VGNNYRDATAEIQRKRSASPHPEADSTSPKKARIEEDVSATEAVVGSQSLSTFKDEDDRHLSTQAGSVHLTSNNEVSIGLDSPREPDAVIFPRSRSREASNSGPTLTSPLSIGFHKQDVFPSTSSVLQRSSSANVHPSENYCRQDFTAPAPNQYPPIADGRFRGPSVSDFRPISYNPAGSFSASCIFRCLPSIVFWTIDEASFFLSSVDFLCLFLVYGVTYLPATMEFFKFAFVSCFQDPIIWWPWKPPLAHDRRRIYWNCVCALISCGSIFVLI
jgi:hypothetical protein